MSLSVLDEDFRYGRVAGLVLVALVHVGLIYALVTGLATRAVEVIPAAIEAQIITPPPQEKLEPPPPPPEFHPPPPLFVPPPEVHIETPPPPPKNTITTFTMVKPPAAPAPPAPPAPAPHQAVTVLPRIDLAHSREPQYPPAARRLGEQGSVILQVLVSAAGRVLAAKVVQSSGSDRLDEAAVAGVKEGYRFFPATVDGTPAEMSYTFKFTWKLK